MWWRSAGAVVVAGGLVVGVAGPAEAASRGYGYVLVTQHKKKIGKAYRVGVYKNSAGAAPTVVRTGTGTYTVRFPKLGRSGGVAHVTAYGGTSNSCSVVGWKAAKGGRLDVRVHCVNIDGGRANTRFSLAYTNITTMAGRYGYVVSDAPTAAQSTPAASRRFNSRGGVNTISRIGTGRYEVLLPKLDGAHRGQFQITAYGAVRARCGLAGISSAGTEGGDLAVAVNCRDLDGAFRDSRFTLTAAANTGLQRRGPAAYSVVDVPEAPAPRPGLAAFTFNSADEPVTYTREEKGLYSFDFPGQNLSKGNVQVTALNNVAVHCGVVRWNPDDNVLIKCHDLEGTRADAVALVSFQR
ncbi:hypothetical protein GCM10027589_06040 [Actinocorallia lasiicapitis]